MASKNIRDQKPASRNGKPAKSGGEIKDRELDKVSGGMSVAAGLPTGKRNHLSVTGDPCEGGE